MSSFKNRYQEKQRKDTLAMLKRVMDGVRSGEFLVTANGLYRAGLDGKYTLRVDIVNRKESNSLEDIG